MWCLFSDHTQKNQRIVTEQPQKAKESQINFTFSPSRTLWNQKDILITKLTKTKKQNKKKPKLCFQRLWKASMCQCLFVSVLTL